MLNRFKLRKYKSSDFSNPKKFSTIELSRKLPFPDILCRIPFLTNASDNVYADTATLIGIKKTDLCCSVSFQRLYQAYLYLG